jgi:hypothetical protein
MKKCKSCGCDLPTKRIELEFKHCVTCSTTERYGTVDIVYHKTGNTVQHVSAETAKQVNKLATRRGFGSSLGRISAGSAGGDFTKKKYEYGASIATIGSKEMFQTVGDEVMTKFEIFGYDSAMAHIQRCFNSVRINQIQAFKLKQVINALSGN